MQILHLVYSYILFQALPEPDDTSLEVKELQWSDIEESEANGEETEVENSEEEEDPTFLKLEENEVGDDSNMNKTSTRINPGTKLILRQYSLTI